MTEGRLAALVALLVACPLPAIAVEDDWRRLHEVSLAALPVSVMVGAHSVTIAHPADPSIQEFAGSGGPFLRLQVEPVNVNAPQQVVTHVQAIAVAVLDSADPLPQFELWTADGVGHYVRARLAWRGTGYCYLETADYEQPLDDSEDARAISLPGGDERAVFRRRGEGTDCPPAPPCVTNGANSSSERPP